METQFITNEQGEKLAAIIPIEHYRELIEELEDLEDTKDLAELRKEPRTPWKDVKNELIADGLLPG